MTQLLEIKDKIIKFYGCYELYLNMVVKFVVALAVFLIINANIGYMERINSVPIALVLALICCVLPQNATVLLAGVVVLLHLYAISVETALVGFALLVLIYLVYFRFSPKDGLLAVLTPVSFKLNIPYIVPIGGALLRPISSQLAVICGTVFYYFLHGVNQNAPVLSAAAAAAEEEASESPSAFHVVIGQLTGNKEMFLAVGVFVVTGLVVYFVRRMNMDYAWTIAIIAGVLIQAIGFFVGYLILNVSGKTLWVILGNLISLLLGWLLQFFFMNLDYARTERVQFQDDEYYYYVRAVPKKMVATQDKKVKRFGNTASMGKRIDRGDGRNREENEETSRRMIARELNIDEDLLK